MKKEKSQYTRKSPDAINEFVIKELDFNNNQAEQFRPLSKEHRSKQVALQEDFRYIKRQMNRNLLDSNEVETDSLISLLGEITVNREKALLSFFSEVLKFCTDDQKGRLQQVFLEATRPPDHAKIPMSVEKKHHPR